ncbi:helix-turn-helix domain-containing protein [Halapricum salinum]|nr:helix-turn-helix domain-containing protein [Halapricum salinum]
MCPATDAGADLSDRRDRLVRDSKRRLTAELVVTFDPSECACPVVLDCETASPIDHHVIDDTCHVTCRGAEDETAVHHRQTQIDGECICRIIARNGCNPSLQSISDYELLVRTNPPDRETLRALVSDLGTVAETVRLQQLVVDTDEDESRSELVNLDGLTDTERETIDRAIVAGYYDRPRSISFDDLAAELDVSKSALSKRLSSVESKIMRDLFHDIE